MNSEEITREIMTGIESGDLDTVAGYLSDDFVFSGPVPEPISGEEWLGMQRLLHVAFPDWSFNISNMETTDSGVRVTYQITGTHTGDLNLSPMGMPVIPATGKSIQLPVEHADFTFEGDKAVKFHTAAVEGAGLPGLLHQLGVDMPPPG